MVAVAVSVAGCVGPLTKNVSQQEAQADEDACRYQASMATGSMANEVERSFRKNDLMRECLRMRGYR